MTIIDTWLHKIERIMFELQKDFMVSISQENVEETTLQQLRKEFENSKYTLSNTSDFLSKCSKQHIYELDGIRLTLLCMDENNTTREVGTEKIGKMKKMNTKIIRSLFRLKTIRSLFHIENKLQIVLLPIEEPRIKPQHGDHVQPKHINGAYTYISDGTIYIYRLEEWPKVILHEVLHNVPRLQGIQWTEKEINTLYREFGIDTTGCPVNCKTVLEPTEAVIETWAIFLHTAFLAIERDNDFYKLLEEELQWNDQQIRWISEKQHGGEKRRGMNKGGGRDIRVWYEDTHAFSYIVLRGILLHHLETFLKMKIPYSGERLLKLFLKEWNLIRERILKIPYQKNKSFRMSKFGDL